MQTIAPAQNFNPLPNSSKRNSGESLIGLVADTVGLYHQVKTAHWNVRGQGFLSIHRLLDEVATTLLTAIDEMAERARQLGLIVDGNLKTVASMSRIEPFPTGIVTTADVCSILGGSCATLIDTMRKTIENVSGEHPDPITADLLTRTSGKLEVQLWLMESHLP